MDTVESEPTALFLSSETPTLTAASQQLEHSKRDKKIDFLRGVFDVGKKGDVHENVFSKPFNGDFPVGMLYLRRV